ncbi:hypothetical protein CHU98_g12572 [Xylaria longipes]|nr:hypothetical protein CHU98_g12572 [Xylaria longipes]
MSLRISSRDDTGRITAITDLVTTEGARMDIVDTAVQVGVVGYWAAHRVSLADTAGVDRMTAGVIIADLSMASMGTIMDTTAITDTTDTTVTMGTTDTMDIRSRVEKE